MFTSSTLSTNTQYSSVILLATSTLSIPSFFGGSGRSLINPFVNSVNDFLRLQPSKMNERKTAKYGQ